MPASRASSSILGAHPATSKRPAASQMQPSRDAAAGPPLTPDRRPAGGKSLAANHWLRIIECASAMRIIVLVA
jgi:hypothetical protein